MNIKKMFSKEFIGWDDYKRKIDFIDMFAFQQATRKHNIRNI